MHVVSPIARYAALLLAAAWLLAACGGQPSTSQPATSQPAASQPEPDERTTAAAEAAFNAWATGNGEPYRDVQIMEDSNDGFFAKMHVLAWFRPDADSEWEERETRIECRQVGDVWQCDRDFNFALSAGETERRTGTAGDSAAQLGFGPVTLDAASGVLWAINPADNASYIYVPAGEFLMGSADGQGESNEHPQHTVHLDGYWIMQTEVTNAQYARCVAAGVCSASATVYWQDETLAKLPVTGVDWSQAQAYARWVGGRLPTEAEWEKAARGTDGRIYPWGNGPAEPDRTNCCNFAGGAEPVGSYGAGASPYRVLDMAGNVWEWVNDWYQPDYYSTSPQANPQGPEMGEYRVLRGGAYLNEAENVRSAFRYWFDPADRLNGIGFRVVAGDS